METPEQVRGLIDDTIDLLADTLGIIKAMPEEALMGFWEGITSRPELQKLGGKQRALAFVGGLAAMTIQAQVEVHKAEAEAAFAGFGKGIPISMPDNGRGN